MKNKLIIFDMDNTILQSNIDFDLMQQTVNRLMQANGLEQYIRQTSATTLQDYAASADYDPDFAAELWRQIALIEMQGMENAVLEPGAAEALSYLSRYATLAVLTNNTDANLADHLGRLKIMQHLSCVVGRDTAGCLKPAPHGFLHIAAQYPDITAEKTVAVGDASIDALAAQSAGIDFAAYNRSRMEQWHKFGVEPKLRLTCWSKAACDALLSLIS